MKWYNHSLVYLSNISIGNAINSVISVDSQKVSQSDIAQQIE